MTIYIEILTVLGVLVNMIEWGILEVTAENPYMNRSTRFSSLARRIKTLLLRHEKPRDPINRGWDPFNRWVAQRLAFSACPRARLVFSKVKMNSMQSIYCPR
jgi:hypothetical protein